MEAQFPRVSDSRIGAGDPHQVYEHDAYGLITMTTPRGGRGVLFGSDIQHNQRVRISIQRASLHRDLNRDWIHPESGLPLVEFEMSHAQFAQFITSNASGSGTPVTLTFAPPREVASQEVPGIRNLENKHETFRREIKDSAQEQVGRVAEMIDRLGAMLDGGSLSKKELRELHQKLKWAVENIPGNMEYVVLQAEKALEKATSDAKIEVETYISMAARRLGLGHISQLGLLEGKE